VFGRENQGNMAMVGILKHETKAVRKVVMA
jgi:hypothetical protein